mmetsp:Transcript_89712/g.142776  ORF Transcript_89712/g.142776 Transcript_89712/m.142776 type:complete len:432 (-) Transcript_89712:50-1345(-)
MSLCETTCSLLVVEGCDTWKFLPLQQLKGGTTTSTAVGDLVLSAILLAGSGRVTTTNHGDDTLASRLHNCIHQLFGARLEFGHLEHAHGAIPDDSLGFSHGLGVQLHRGWSAVQSHETLRDAICLCDAFFDLSIFSELGRAGEIHGQDDLNTQLLSLGQDLGHNLGTFLVIEGAADGHVVLDLQKSVGHPAANDHLVHLVQHVHDQLDLVADLGTSQDGEHRLGRAVQNLGKGLQLFAHQIARTFHLKAFTHHGTVRTVSSAKGIVAVDVRQFPDGCTKFLDLLLVSLDLVALRVDTLALFLNMESQILQQDDRTSCRISASRLNFWPHAILAECHWFAEFFFQDLGNWRQGILFHNGTIRSAEMRCQHYRLGTFLQNLLDSGQGTVDALSVSDLRGIRLVLRHVEVNPHEDTLASHIHIVNAQLGRHCDV